MMFCEQCGSKLNPGAHFCEECGAAVVDGEAIRKDCSAEDSREDETSVFCGNDWASKWLKVATSCGNVEVGVLMTRESALAEQLGVGREVIHAILSSYIGNMKTHDVNYCYLDLDNCPFYSGKGDVGSVVAALRAIVDIARPKYLFIVGNEDIIDVARWENEARDSDEEVESDLCYATLDVNSPWNGQTYKFDDALRVGRFPTCKDESLEVFSHYFDHAPRSNGRLGELIPYGLSALVWEDESNDEYRAVSRDSVDVSPEVTKESVEHRIPKNANLMFFNLHGSNNTKYWYGQEGGSYPEAFLPEVLSGWSSPYFIGVEACYGARYVGQIPSADSIVMTALRNNCLAFLGSSRIAFGTSEPKGSCADIVVGEYIKCLPKGHSAGDAYLEGLKALAHDPSSMDDSDIKTLAEFALYGDPSVRMNTQKPAGLMKAFFKGVVAPKGMFVPMPDVRKAVRMAIAEVDAKIESIIDDYYTNHVMPQLAAGLSDVRQSVFKMSNTGLNQKIYIAQSNGMTRVAKIYFDDRGTVKKTLISK